MEQQLREFLKEVNAEIVEELKEDSVEDKMNDCMKYGCTIVAQLQWVESRIERILGEG